MATAGLTQEKSFSNTVVTPLKKPGTEFAFENVGQFLGRLDAEFLRDGVHVFFGRGEKYVNALLFPVFPTSSLDTYADRYRRLLRSARIADG